MRNNTLSTRMRIAFITDLHIGLEGEDTYGIDVRNNFLAVLAAATASLPDFVVLGGDLCYSHGDEAIYPWIKAQLDATGITYHFISGNHDNPAMMAAAFSRKSLLKEGQLYYSAPIGTHQAIFLDTTNGHVDGKQLEWLKKELDLTVGEVLVFMHHPPVLAGVPFMDNNYPLVNHNEILQLVLNAGKPVHVFSGHYHVEKTISKAQVNVYITPSCFFQIGQQTTHFEVDHYRPGWRIIDMTPGELRTTVCYTEGATVSPKTDKQ